MRNLRSKSHNALNKSTQTTVVQFPKKKDGPFTSSCAKLLAKRRMRPSLKSTGNLLMLTVTDVSLSMKCSPKLESKNELLPTHIDILS